MIASKPNAEEAVSAFGKLTKFIASSQAPPNCMSMGMIDGFVTGLAIGPVSVRPCDWIPKVWSVDDLRLKERA